MAGVLNKKANATTPSAEGKKPNAYANVYVKMSQNGRMRSVKLGAISLWEDDAVQQKFLNATDDMDEEQQKEFLINLLSKGSVQVVRVENDDDANAESEFVL